MPLGLLGVIFGDANGIRAGGVDTGGGNGKATSGGGGRISDAISNVGFSRPLDIIRLLTILARASLVRELSDNPSRPPEVGVVGVGGVRWPLGVARPDEWGVCGAAPGEWTGTPIPSSCK